MKDMFNHMSGIYGISLIPFQWLVELCEKKKSQLKIQTLGLPPMVGHVSP